jgi:hypothetical protein
MKSEDLKEKLDDFIQLFGSSSDKVKKQVNYYSTVNIATELIRMENISNAKPYRVIISEYFDLIRSADLSNEPQNQVDLYKLYKSHVSRAGVYLMHEKGFKHKNSNLYKFIVLGILLDAFVYFNFKDTLPIYFPIFSLTLLCLGLFKTKKVIADKKAFGRGY